MLEPAELLPNSLPSLHSLSANTAIPAGLLGSIFAAAGPGLTQISIEDGRTLPTAMRLLKENEHVWAPSLQSLWLRWARMQRDYGAQLSGPDTPRQVAETLSRLPALMSLYLAPQEADEMLVRLLALAERGGLQSLTTVRGWTYGPPPPDGAVLLLLLWLKREAKKALPGEEGALWNVERLHSYEEMHPFMQQITETILEQLKEARKQICKARGGV